MKRSRAVALVVTTALVGALALMVSGTAAAAQSTLHSYGLTAAATPTAIVPGGTVTITGAVTDWGIGIPNGRVDFYDYGTATGCSAPEFRTLTVTPDPVDLGHTHGSIQLFHWGEYTFTTTLTTLGVHNLMATANGKAVCMQVVVSLTPVPTSSGPDHYGYCSVAGNSNPYTGQPYGVNTFLSLHQGQPAEDEHYTGATPAFWVEGVGITCDLTPAQAALAAASTTKVNHVGATTLDEGPPFYTFVPAP